MPRCSYMTYLLFQVLISDVNDNWPILPKISYSFSPIPPLVKAAFFIIKATDLDSDENAKISYIPERVAEWSVGVFYVSVRPYARIRSKKLKVL